MMLRQIELSLGSVEGMASEDPTITVFRGIPFAKPPVGELRWRAPQPVEAWNGVLHAYDFAPMSMQPVTDPHDFYGREWEMDPQFERSEDSLYLNVWTPALCGAREEAHLQDDIAAHGLPVMVWIYGGAYQCGSTAEKEFDGYALARHGVVVVSVSYRLNVFGFFAHADLQGRGGEPVANFGLQDQRMALLWVHEHIAAFGGDPDNITVFGQSAGAASVLAQICSPMDRGLFSRAIMQSGGGVGMFNKRIWSLEESQRNGARFLDYVGVRSVEEARGIPAETLLAAAEELPSPPGGGREGEWSMMANWLPCIDGRLLTDQYESTIASGRCNADDILLGNTTGEFYTILPDGSRDAEGERGNLALMSAWLRGGGKAPYYYRFDVDMPGDDAGAFHSSDLWFTFDSLGKCWRPFEGWHYNLARVMCTYWANFAKAGDPNGKDAATGSLPQWERFAPDAPQAMHFGKQIGMRSW